jgi:hypothetical protein
MSRIALSLNSRHTALRLMPYLASRAFLPQWSSSAHFGSRPDKWKGNWCVWKDIYQNFSANFSWWKWITFLKMESVPAKLRQYTIASLHCFTLQMIVFQYLQLLSISGCRQTLDILSEGPCGFPLVSSRTFRYTASSGMWLLAPNHCYFTFSFTVVRSKV